MAASPFAMGIEMLSNSRVERPPLAKISTRVPSNDELDSIELPTYGLTRASTKQEACISTATTADELERSEPPTPQRDAAVSVMPSFSHPPMNKWRVLSACGQYFVNGMNDSAPGPLIPYIEQWYGIGYAVVSTIWISNAVGFILAAFVSDLLRAKLGRAKCLMLSESICIVAYTIVASPVPFPVVVVAFMLIGFGQAVTIALNNVFLANLANSTVVLGAGHGSYGIGGTIAPLLATAMVSAGLHWSRFFIIAIGIRMINLVAVGWSFKDYEKEDGPQFSNALEQIASAQAGAQSGDNSKLKAVVRALKKKTTIIGALFIFAYQGAEVAEAGWVTTYLIEVSIVPVASVPVY
jgi:fucose permease